MRAFKIERENLNWFKINFTKNKCTQVDFMPIEWRIFRRNALLKIISWKPIDVIGKVIDTQFIICVGWKWAFIFINLFTKP